MKKSILAFLTLVLVNSCQTKYCWKCMSTGRTNGSTQSQTTNVLCDMTKSEIENYEKTATTTQTIITSNGSIIVDVTTDCKIQ
jgi:hypothetical protein